MVTQRGIISTIVDLFYHPTLNEVPQQKIQYTMMHHGITAWCVMVNFTMMNYIYHVLLPYPKYNMVHHVVFFWYGDTMVHYGTSHHGAPRCFLGMVMPCYHVLLYHAICRGAPWCYHTQKNNVVHHGDFFAEQEPRYKHFRFNGRHLEFPTSCYIGHYRKYNAIVFPNPENKGVAFLIYDVII